MRTASCHKSEEGRAAGRAAPPPQMTSQRYSEPSARGLSSWARPNILKKEEMRLKGKADALKKDRIKDMHASIANMILMALATIGNFCNSFKAFYNSKNQGYADMELHHQFDAKDLQNVGFAEGTVLALWSRLLKRSNPAVPSNCTPFAFCKIQPANMNQKA
jgi:hypothetical protein